MILRFQWLCQFPTAFVNLTGLDLGEFDRLLAEITPHYHDADRRRRTRPDRHRAIGGGDHMDLDLRDQLLLTLIWHHHFPRQDILGQFFGISQPTVWRCTVRMTPLLADVAYYAKALSIPSRKQRLTMAQFLDKIPELIGMIGDCLSRLQSAP